MRAIPSSMILIRRLGMTPKARVSYPILYDIHTSDFTVKRTAKKLLNKGGCLYLQIYVLVDI